MGEWGKFEGWGWSGLRWLGRMSGRGQMSGRVGLEWAALETSENVRCEKTSGSSHIVMMQGRLISFEERGGAMLHAVDVIIPTTVVDDTTAESSLGVMHLRVAWLFDAIAKGVPMVVVLNSDSAKANLRLARHFLALAQSSTSLMLLPSRCMMHMTAAAVSHCMQAHHLISPLFCATLQLHHGHIMRKLRSCVNQLIEDNLVVTSVWREEWEHSRISNRAMVDLLFSKHIDPDAADGEPSSRHKRLEAGKRLVELLPQNWLTEGGHQIVHFCPFGCCSSREDCVSKVQSTLDDFLLSCRPRVPALNRWTRMYQPTAWWAVACALLQIVPMAWSRMKPPPQPDCLAFVAGDPAHPGNENTYRAQQKIRWEKASAWIHAETTLPRLLTCVSLMLPALDIMSDIFGAGKKSISVIQFSDWNTSPAAHAISHYSNLLEHLDEPFWMPVRLGTSWSQGSLRRAFNVVMTMVGNIFLRTIIPFRAWPWYLARLTNDATPAAVKTRIASDFWKAKSCCLDSGFSKKFRTTVASEADVMSASSLGFLRQAFENVPVNNVKVEAQFGRQRNASANMRGQAPDASTLASKHVVGEIHHLYKKMAMHKKVMMQGDNGSGIDMVGTSSVPPIRSGNVKRKRCAWNEYVSKQKGRFQAGLTMAECSNEFKALSAEQKRDYLPLPINDANDADHTDATQRPGLILSRMETPLSLGDAIYPVCADVVQEV